MSLVKNFKSVFDNTEEKTIGSILHTFGAGSFGFLIVLLALPVALPFTPPGVSTPFGVLILIISIQMLIGRKDLWMPKFITRRKVKFGESKFVDKMASWLQFFEKITNKRQTWMFRGPAYLILISSLIASSLVLVLLPLPVINTLASGVCMVIGLALLEEDGMMAFAGIVASLIMVGICIASFGTIIAYLVSIGIIRIN